MTFDEAKKAVNLHLKKESVGTEEIALLEAHDRVLSGRCGFCAGHSAF